MGQHEGEERRDRGKPGNGSERMCEMLRHSEQGKPAQTRGRQAGQPFGSVGACVKAARCCFGSHEPKFRADNPGQVASILKSAARPRKQREGGELPLREACLTVRRPGLGVVLAAIPPWIPTTVGRRRADGCSRFFWL